LKGTIDTINSDMELISYTLDSILNDADNVNDESLITETIQLHKKNIKKS